MLRLLMRYPLHCEIYSPMSIECSSVVSDFPHLFTIDSILLVEVVEWRFVFD